MRKYLHKFKIIYRNKINIKSYQNLQLDLIDNNIKIDDNYNNLNIPIIDSKLKNLLPENFIFFQFRYLFFKKLNWSNNEFEYLIKEIQKKFKNVLFSSDIEDNINSKLFNNFFKKNYSIIDTYNYKKKIHDQNKNIFYLENINAKNLFF